MKKDNQDLEIDRGLRGGFAQMRKTGADKTERVDDRVGAVGGEKDEIDGIGMEAGEKGIVAWLIQADKSFEELWHVVDLLVAAEDEIGKISGLVNGETPIIAF
jgi:hypothetical protein